MPRRDAIALAFAVAAFALVASGCGEKAEPDDAVVNPTYPLTVRDARGRAVEVDARPPRVATLDDGAAALLERLRVHPLRLPGDASPDQVARSRASLVILPGTASDEDADALARELRAPVFVMAGRRLVSLERATADLGLVVGRALPARNLALDLRERRLAVQQRVAGKRRARVFIDTGIRFAPPRNSLWVTLVRVAGGRLVGLGGAQPVTAARLRALRPDVYLATRRSGVTLSGLRRRPATARLRAVRAGRFGIVDERKLHADEGAYALLEQIARVLHPRGRS